MFKKFFDNMYNLLNVLQVAEEFDFLLLILSAWISIYQLIVLKHPLLSPGAITFILVMNCMRTNILITPSRWNLENWSTCKTTGIFCKKETMESVGLCQWQKSWPKFASVIIQASQIEIIPRVSEMLTVSEKHVACNGTSFMFICFNW